ncbi:MAG: glycosyltransferase family 2 protein [Planctomycetota bacterium]
MNDGYEISIVIPTCPNRSAKLRTLLSGLGSSTANHNCFEVIVVVDEQDQGPLETAAVLPADIRFVGLTQPKQGPAAARNLAVERATGRWLLMFNDDAVVDAETIAGHLELIRRDPEARVAYLGRFDWLEELIDSPWRYLLANTSMLFFWDQMQTNRTYGFRHFWTTNLSVSTDLVRQAGGFNESFPYALHEDIELGWRLEHLFGVQVRPVPAISAWHDHAITPADYFHREYFAGQAAALARTSSPDFHDAVWGWLDDPRRAADLLGSLFATPTREIRQLLEDWSVPSDYRPSATELRAVYLAHLPLKRLAFCQGYADRPFDLGSPGSVPANRVGQVLTSA